MSQIRGPGRRSGRTDRRNMNSSAHSGETCSFHLRSRPHVPSADDVNIQNLFRFGKGQAHMGAMRFLHIFNMTQRHEEQSASSSPGSCSRTAVDLKPLSPGKKRLGSRHMARCLACCVFAMQHVDSGRNDLQGGVSAHRFRHFRNARAPAAPTTRGQNHRPRSDHGLPA